MLLLCLLGVALALAVPLAAAQPFNFSRGTGGWVDASSCGGVPSCIASLGCSQLDRGNSGAGWCGDDCLSDFNVSVLAEEAGMFCCGEEFRCPVGSSGCCEIDDEFRCFDNQDSCDEKCAAPRGGTSCSTCGEERTGLIDCERGFFCLSQDKCGPRALGIVLLILSLLSLPCCCLGCTVMAHKEERGQYKPLDFLTYGTPFAFCIALGVGIYFLIAGLYVYAVLIFSLPFWIVATCGCYPIFGQKLPSSFNADEFAEWLQRKCRTKDGVARLGFVGLKNDSIVQLAAGMLKVWGTSADDRVDVEEDDFPTLKKLFLHCNSFGDAGLGALAEALSHLSRFRETLEVLSIRGNEYIRTLAPLADAGVFEGLKELDVSKCSLSGDESVLPPELCANLPALEKLDLSLNEGCATVTLTAEALCALPAKCKVALFRSKVQVARFLVEDGEKELVALPTEEFGAYYASNIKTVAEICAFAGVSECDWDPEISQELSPATSSSDDCSSVELSSSPESSAISISSSASSDNFDTSNTP